MLVDRDEFEALLPMTSSDRRSYMNCPPFQVIFAELEVALSATLRQLGVTWDTLPGLLVQTKDTGERDLGLVFEMLLSLTRVLKHWQRTGMVSPRQAYCSNIAGRSSSEKDAYAVQLAARKRQEEEEAERGKPRKAIPQRRSFDRLAIFLKKCEEGHSARERYFQDNFENHGEITKAVRRIKGQLDLAGDSTPGAVKQALFGQGSRANCVAVACLIGKAPSFLWPALPVDISYSDVNFGNKIVELLAPRGFHPGSSL